MIHVTIQEKKSKQFATLCLPILSPFCANLPISFCSEMANAWFSFSPFDFNGFHRGYSTHDLEYYEKDEAVIKGKQDHMFPMEEDLGQAYPLCSEDGAYNFSKDQQQQQQRQQPKSYYLTFDDYFNSCFPAPAQPMHEIKKIENIVKPGKEMSHPSDLSSSLELLNNYGSGFKKLINKVNKDTYSGSPKKLSTEEIIRVAGARYIQFFDQRYDDFSLLMHPFGYALSGLSEEETRDVELAHLLLAAAEKVGYQQYDRASRLLSRCEWIASERSNPLQRVVYCFAEALRERIDKATGRSMRKDNLEGETEYEKLHGCTNLAYLTFHQTVPFNQVMQLTAIQAIIENIGSARKLHMIDLQIRSGVQWTALMQALADGEQRSRLEHLKITAIGVGLAGKQKIEETGRRLENFAKSMNLPFTFKAVYVSSMNDIKEELFETAADESVVIVSNMILRSMISRPGCLENLMKVIQNLNPSLMIVGEVEANHNSPTFVTRFIEALFFYSVYFDCLEACMNQNIEHRMMTEAVFCHGIHNTVALEGPERTARNVKIDVWRAFFSRFRMMEIGFSESSLYQASLVPKQFPCGSSCTLDKDGKCLIVGWKGTPLHSLSAWKFSRERFWRSFLNYSF